MNHNRLSAERLELYEFFFSSRRRHTRCSRDWSSDVCSSDLGFLTGNARYRITPQRALPVKKPLITVMPFRNPTIEQLLSQKPGDKFPAPNQPIVVGDTLVLQGKQFLGDTSINTFIRIAGELVAPLAQDASNTQLSVVVPPTAVAGVQGI